MTIKKGESWGEEVALAEGGALAGSDAELARQAAGGAKLVRLTGGDLLRTLGGSSSLGEGRIWSMPIDIGVCSFGGRDVHFAAHCALYPRRWGLPSLVVMNAEYFGNWDLTPKGHPNDGRFEAVELSLPRKDRRQFRRRVVTGSHLPHPGISIRRVKKLESNAKGRLVLDGIDYGRVEGFEVRVIPDAMLVAI